LSAVAVSEAVAAESRRGAIAANIAKLPDLLKPQ
jgi:hypothetical protein